MDCPHFRNECCEIASALCGVQVRPHATACAACSAAAKPRTENHVTLGLAVGNAPSDARRRQLIARHQAEPEIAAQLAASQPVPCQHLGEIAELIDGDLLDCHCGSIGLHECGVFGELVAGRSLKPEQARLLRSMRSRYGMRACEPACPAYEAAGDRQHVPPAAAVTATAADRVYLLGYPGDVGGAGTEAWATIKLWRDHGLDVHLVPTWSPDARYRPRCDAIGCVTHRATAETLDQVPGLAGSVVVAFCNAAFLASASKLRDLGCRLVWANCMTWAFDAERKHYADRGTFDAHVFQSEFQRSELTPILAEYGYVPAQGHLIRGAFDFDVWPFQPRAHAAGEPFVVGRISRADKDKWSSNTWKIYERIQYAPKQAMMLGMSDDTHKKCGPPPKWANCLKPGAMPAPEFFRQLHCALNVNGGARENWPRVGLEAMAAGVPIVTQNQWGWREMIRHGETGFLCDTDEELAHWTAVLAHDEDRRLAIATAARQAVEQLADPATIWAGWRKLFASVGLEVERTSVRSAPR